MSENNGNLLQDYYSGKITLEQLNAALEEMKSSIENAKPFLRSGKNYRALTWENFAKVGDDTVNVYVAGEKVNSLGSKVEPKPRTTTATGTGRKKKTS